MGSDPSGYSLGVSSSLSALILVCTLKQSPSDSSSALLASQVLAALTEQDVSGEIVRVVDHGVRFGVSTDEGDGDGWPAIRDKMLASDLLVIATPIWMGQPSSVCKMVLERLDAELSETDDSGRLLTYGKVALVAVVGNEDGAHHVVAECLQALNDTGFSVAPNAGTYWVGQAMQTVDYQDLDPSPEETVSATTSAVGNAVHLAGLLKARPTPPRDDPPTTGGPGRTVPLDLTGDGYGGESPSTRRFLVKAVVYKGPREVGDRGRAGRSDRGTHGRLDPDHHDEHLRLGPAHVRGPHRVEEGKVLGHENMGIVEEVGAGGRPHQGRRPGLGAVQHRLRHLPQLQRGLDVVLPADQPDRGHGRRGLRLRQHGPVRRRAG